ncbi:hypothetical protein pb186bvf_012833 [Paramecium bursaria]
MYSYKESCKIMFTPYIAITLLWIPLTRQIENYYQDPLIVSSLVDFIATAIVFIQSYIYKNTSIYDPYWQIPPFYLLFYWIYRAPIIHNIWIVIVPFVYFTRHNFNYFIFWPGMQYEDFRYPMFKRKFKSDILYWIFSFVGLHEAVTLIIIVGLTPTYFSIFQSTGIQNIALFYFGVIFALSAITFEAIADWQLLPWRSRKTDKFIDEGLWRYSRHPNYFGECMFWWGIFIMALGLNLSNWFTIIGPLTLQGLFLFFSIPAMEKHLLAKRPTYKLQQQRVSAFIPWFRKEKI